MKIQPKKILITLLAISGVLGILYLVLYSCINSENGDLSWLTRFFDLDNEVSLPTWFSQILLFISALLLGYIAIVRRNLKDKFWKYWMALAGILTIASIDEGASIHERIDALMNLTGLRDGGNTSGILFYDWWIYVLPILVVIGIFFIKFFFTLPKRTKILFIVSCGIFLIGSVGFEVLGGILRFSSETFELNPIVITLEECFEMFGVSIFIYSLLDYLKIIPEKSRSKIVHL
jgi:hypothetical protein